MNPVDTLPAIIVIAYERANSLNRLLISLNKSVYPSNKIKLVITIGKKDGNEDVLSIAEGFIWDHGDKVIDYFNSEMSITRHLEKVYHLVNIYENIIILEDDLYVSPMFYFYSQQALEIFGQHPKIAGISLNNVWFNGYTKYPFIPLKDSADNYFMQLPFFQGQVFSKTMIAKYIKWQEGNKWEMELTFDDLIHKSLVALSKQPDEWFPMMTKYLIDTKQYFIFPYYSLSTNFGDEGKHFLKKTNFFQTGFQTRKTEYKFTEFESSISIYDSFQEIIPECIKKIVNIDDDFDVDLNGTKPLRVLKSKLVLTIREVKSHVLSYGTNMKPLEQNIISDIPGLGIKLALKEEMIFSKKTDKQLKRFYFAYNNIDSYQPSLFEAFIIKIRKIF